MTNQYAHIVNDEILGVGPTPRWITDEGEPLTEAEWAEHDRFPVQDADPIPEGKISTGREVEIIDGKPKWVNTLIDTPPPSKRDVDAERDDRIHEGFDFAGVTYQTRQTDLDNIAGAATAALGAMVAGAQPEDLRWHGGDTDFQWIAMDNTTTPMDAQTTFAFASAAMAHKQAHIFAGRALKDADPIPADYADDANWP